MTRELRRFSAKIVWASIACAGTMSAVAAHANSVGIRITPGTGVPLTRSDSGSTAVEVSGDAAGDFDAIGSALAFADFGVLKIKGAVKNPIEALASATFGDLFTITSPEVVNGTAGELGFSVTLSGNLESSAGLPGSGGAVLNWRLRAEVSAGGTSVRGVLNKSGGQNVLGYAGDPFGTYVGTIPFVFGRPELFTMSLFGGASSGHGDTGFFDLSRSLYWNGISGMTASGEIPVNTFTLASESGTDYRLSFVPTTVPESASALLFGCGLVAIALRHRGRRTPL